MLYLELNKVKAMNWFYLVIGIGLLATLFKKSEKPSEIEEAEQQMDKLANQPRPKRKPLDNGLYNNPYLNKPWGTSKYK